MRALGLSSLLFLLPVACEAEVGTRPPQNAPAPPPAGSPWTPTPRPAATPTATPPLARPLLAPLSGMASLEAEVQAVLQELVANLLPGVREKVQAIPLVFEPVTEINAFAGCDEQGAAFLAGTHGLLRVVEAMGHTQAADELYGTQSYASYLGWVVPRITSSGEGVDPTLPQGLIPQAQWGDPRRLSRARELFDEILAFTFAHELAHHYLGHTGCAGRLSTSGPNPARMGHLLTRALPALNQPNEIASDNAGVIHVLETGRVRARLQAYMWSERGGLTLLDFFSRLDTRGLSGLLSPVAILRTHPVPALRIPLVQVTANTFRTTRR